MGHVAGRGYIGYGTVKGAVEQYTRLASRDLAPRIRVNAIGVGSTATSALDIVMSSDELRTAMEDVTPLRRIGERRGHRGRHPLPGLAGRVLRHRQGDRGRRRAAVAQPRVPDPGPVEPPLDRIRPGQRSRTMPYRVVAMEHRERRAPRPRRHRRPSRARARRPLRLQPGQGRPGRRRAGRPRAHPRRRRHERRRRAAGAPTRLHRPHRHGRRPHLRGAGRPGALPRPPASTSSPPARSCCSTPHPTTPSPRPSSRRPSGRASRSSSTASTPALRTTRSRSCSRASASGSRRSAARRCSTTTPTTSPWSSSTSWASAATCTTCRCC